MEKEGEGRGGGGKTPLLGEIAEVCSKLSISVAEIIFETLRTVCCNASMRPHVVALLQARILENGP